MSLYPSMHNCCIYVQYVYPSTCLSMCPSTCLPICLPHTTPRSICASLSTCISSFLPACYFQVIPLYPMSIHPSFCHQHAYMQANGTVQCKCGEYLMTVGDDFQPAEMLVVTPCTRLVRQRIFETMAAYAKRGHTGISNTAYSVKGHSGCGKVATIKDTLRMLGMNPYVITCTEKMTELPVEAFNKAAASGGRLCPIILAEFCRVSAERSESIFQCAAKKHFTCVDIMCVGMCVVDVCVMAMCVDRHACVCRHMCVEMRVAVCRCITLNPGFALANIPHSIVQKCTQMQICAQICRFKTSVQVLLSSSQRAVSCIGMRVRTAGDAWCRRCPQPRRPWQSVCARC